MTKAERLRIKVGTSIAILVAGLSFARLLYTEFASAKSVHEVKAKQERIEMKLDTITKDLYEIKGLLRGYRAHK